MRSLISDSILCSGSADYLFGQCGDHAPLLHKVGVSSCSMMKSKFQVQRSRVDSLVGWMCTLKVSMNVSNVLVPRMANTTREKDVLKGASSTASKSAHMRATVSTLFLREISSLVWKNSGDDSLKHACAKATQH